MKKLFYFLIPIFAFFGVQTVNAGTFTDIWDTTGYNYNQFYWQQTGTLNKHQSTIFEFTKRDNSFNSAGTYTFTWFLDFPTERTKLECNKQNGDMSCVGYDFITTGGNISSQFNLSAENCITNLASSSDGTYIFNSVCQVADTTVNQGIIDIIVKSNANINVDYTFGMAYRYGYFPLDSTQDDIKKNTEIINSNVNDIKDNLNSSDVSGANSDLNNFTDSDLFKDSTGILAIIQAPINMLNSITSSTCSPLTLPIPYMNFDIKVPCLSTVLSKHFSAELLTLLKLAINGLIIYKVLCSLVMDIHSYKDPDSDRLEVLDL